MRKSKVQRGTQDSLPFPVPPKKTNKELDREFFAKTGFTAAHYDPSHPAYYKLGEVLAVDEIVPELFPRGKEPWEGWPFLRKLPKDPKRRGRPWKR